MKVPEEKLFILTSKVMKDELFFVCCSTQSAFLVIQMSCEETLAECKRSAIKYPNGNVLLALLLFSKYVIIWYIITVQMKHDT